MSLYADDLLLYVNDLVAYFPTISPMQKNFGSFSTGYKLNFQLNKLYPKNYSACYLARTPLLPDLDFILFKVVHRTVKAG